MHAKRMLGDVDMFRADVPYEAHPFAAAIPQMTDEQFGNLVEDINRHGLLHPIVLFEGKVLDGRHRLRACCEANVLPKFIEYSGEDPFGYVISQNINRRQLNRGQLALAAARFATLRQGQKSADTAFAVTQGEVAKRFGVSIDTIHRARVVIESGDNNIIEKVNAGSLSVSAAAAGLQRRGKKLARPAPELNLPDNDNQSKAALVQRLAREVTKLEAAVASVRSRLAAEWSGEHASDIMENLAAMNTIIERCSREVAPHAGAIDRGDL